LRQGEDHKRQDDREIRGLLGLLQSTRLSAWLLILLILIYVMGLVIPQKAILQGEGIQAMKQNSPVLYSFLDWLGFLEIYTSTVAIVLLALFFVNLAMVFSRRTSMILSRCAINVPSRAPAGDAEAEAAVGGQGDERLISRVRGALGGGFSLRGGGGGFIAVRNRYSPVGLLLFHLSFFLLLLAGVMLFYTRSYGVVALTEGQDFMGERWKELKEPHIGGPPEVIFSAMDIRPAYEMGKITDMEVDIAFYRTATVGDFKGHTIRLNHPVKRGSTSILIDRVGVSPLLKFTDQRGEIYEYAYVSLNVLDGQMDSMPIRYTSFKVDFIFYPDYAVKDGLEMTMSPVMRNPVFHAYFYDGARLIWEGIIKPGETADMGPLRMRLENIRYWAEFVVVKEYGRLPLVLGIALGLIGLVWRFFFTRLEVMGYREGDMLKLAVSGGQWKFRAQELVTSLAGKLEEQDESGGADAGT
jgi:hypothetical protein